MVQSLKLPVQINTIPVDVFGVLSYEFRNKKILPVTLNTRYLNFHKNHKFLHRFGVEHKATKMKFLKMKKKFNRENH